MKEKTKIVLQFPDGKFAALDQASGGYPYGVDFDEAHNFQTLEHATRYRSSFKELRIFKMTLTCTLESVEA